MADELTADRQPDRGQDERFGAALFESLVRARLVIVDEELLDHRLQMASAEDEQVVQQLSRAVPMNLSAIEFARGVR